MNVKGATITKFDPKLTARRNANTTLSQLTAHGNANPTTLTIVIIVKPSINFMNRKRKTERDECGYVLGISHSLSVLSKHRKL